MRSEDLQRILRRKPFQPFRVHLKDGRCYDIRFPNHAVVGKTFFDIGIPMVNEEIPIFDHIDSVDPADIERVEAVETTPSSAAD